MNPASLRRVGASLLAAAAVALITHVLAIFPMYLVQNFAPESLGILNGFYLYNTLVLFVVVAILALAGGLTRSWLAVLTGVVAAFMAPVIGAGILVVTGGSPLNAGTIDSIFNSLLNSNLAYLIVTVLAVPTLGRAIYRAVMPESAPAEDTDERPGSRPILLLAAAPAAKPADTVPAGDPAAEPATESLAPENTPATPAEPEAEATTEETAPTPAPVDAADLSYREHFIDADWLIEESDSLDSAPDAPEIAHIGRVLITRAHSALGERLGLHSRRIDGGALLHRDDLLIAADTIYVALSATTNVEGIHRLRVILEPLGRALRVVPVAAGRSLGRAAVALPDGSILADPAAFPNPELLPPVRGCAGDPAATVLDAVTILVAPGQSDLSRTLTDLGFAVVEAAPSTPGSAFILG
ncbi:hypothetical protein [Mycetocola spongiae]|uniref:hypothetical protein n=1 Tax=Mycetocola spongiae TaxID=2859226 RepID=UPI001CF43667|nr:hypothetical protein [Mycetocola spongiae]UCR88686.1 hypothetical protein KXZ72_12075 [Mycetocola spongiae]